MLNRVSTSLEGLDQVIDYLRLGDNVVWQLNDIADYKRIVVPYVRQAQKNVMTLLNRRSESSTPA